MYRLGLSGASFVSVWCFDTHNLPRQQVLVST